MKNELSKKQFFQYYELIYILDIIQRQHKNAVPTSSLHDNATSMGQNSLWLLFLLL